MRLVFVDTSYWVALANPRDQWHQQVRDLSNELDRALLLTSELVLVEFLNFFSGYSSQMKMAAIRMVETISNNPKVKIIPQTTGLFLLGLKLYGDRLDKGYSLTDCVSMIVMDEEGLFEIATNDSHFTQEGLIILIK